MTGDLGGVDRRELIDAARCAPRRVVAVTAPAGYGKTLLLRQWVARDERLVAAASLDPTDDDPDALVATLGRALAPVVGPSGRTPTLRGLSTALSECARPFVLLIDDLHALRSDAALAAVRQLAAHVPAGSQLVTASRSPQPHVPRFRAAGEALELTERHLAFDADAVRTVFARAGVELDPANTQRIVHDTEGWPAVVFLGAVAARQDRSSVVEVAGDDRLVADYLHAEVLAALEPDDRAFLRRAAVLDLLGGGLCDALLERSDSAGRLHDLEDRTRLVIPVGRGRQWYRHHRLVRQFLLSELRREDAALVEGLHLRAATWHEENGTPEEAVEHLLLTGAQERTVGLIESTAPVMWQRGGTDVVQRWLTTLGDQRIAQHPSLAILQAWVGALSGTPATTDRWLAFLESSTDAGEAPLDADLALLRSAVGREGPEAALDDAKRAVDLHEEGTSRHALALVLHGQAHLMLGRTEAAIGQLEAASAAADLTGRHALVLESRATLAWIAMDRGDWEAGAAHTRSARGALEAMLPREHPCGLLARAASARLHLRRGERTEAVRDLADAMASRAASTYARPFPAVKGRLATAKLLWATGDHDGARDLLRELHDIARERPSLATLRDELDGFAAVVGMDGHAREGNAAPLTPAELRVLPYLQTHLTIAQIGDRLFVSRNTANSEIASIYRKLGVSTRSAAVAKATVLGLLGQ